MAAGLAEADWDIVVSDCSLPNFSATAALALLQRTGVDLPFIIVSGDTGENMAAEAMKTGAHDYMMKGELKRLIPIIERELREAAVRREHKRSTEALQESEERLRIAINAAQMYTWDWYVQTGQILWNGHNEAGRKGLPNSEDSYASLLDKIHPEDRKKVEQAVEHAIKGKLSFHVDFRIIRSDKSVRWLETQGQVHRDRAGKGVRMTGISQDITERKQMEEMVQRMAFYDTLTDLANRNMLYDRLLNAIRRDGGQGKPMALLLMDLDRFNEINDTLGHHRGDLLLKEVGKRLKSVLFEPDIVARLGGDEFAVLLPKLAEIKDIGAVIQKLQDVLQSPFIIEGLPVAVEASIGVALYPDHGVNADSLLQRADIAMYAAKGTGSGYRIYDNKDDKHSPRRLALMGELRRAIEKDQLLLHYQPKISLKTQHVMGMEALIRWQHPEYGFVPPDQFILPAEQTGLIHPLTRWVLKAALRQCQAWSQEGLKIPVSVNLSARSLHDVHLPDYLADLLKASGGRPDQLELEITESAIMADPQRALDAISRLRAIGLRFALDDFGIGYSSLAYLKKLPVDAIKIDKSFVIDMAKDEDDTLIVLSTINLAHNLGLKVIAEGVETEMIWERLFAFGCDAAQGYYMSKPLPAVDLTRWLKESPWGFK
jgi:diguanylate cyclase (GGDEF)-like protein